MIDLQLNTDAQKSCSSGVHVEIHYIHADDSKTMPVSQMIQLDFKVALITFEEAKRGVA